MATFVRIARSSTENRTACNVDHIVKVASRPDGTAFVTMSNDDLSFIAAESQDEILDKIANVTSSTIPVLEMGIEQNSPLDVARLDAAPIMRDECRRDKKTVYRQVFTGYKKGVPVKANEFSIFVHAGHGSTNAGAEVLAAQIVTALNAAEL